MFSRQRVRGRQQLINLVSDAPTVQVNNRKAKHPGARGRARRETGVDDHARDRRQSPGADCNEIRFIFEMIQGGLRYLSILSLRCFLSFLSYPWLDRGEAVAFAFPPKFFCFPFLGYMTTEPESASRPQRHVILFSTLTAAAQCYAFGRGQH